MDRLVALRDSLLVSSREREYLELGETEQWTSAEQAEAQQLLLAAAERGDDRAVRALWFTGPQTDVTSLLAALLKSEHDRVAIEAAIELQDRRRSDLEDGGLPRIAAGRMDHQGMVRAIDLMLKAGSESAIRALLRTSTDERVRTVLIERLWDHLRLDLWPSLPWLSLGLLRRRLALPMRSFRMPALIEFESILDVRHPAAAGYAAATTTGGFPLRLTNAMTKLREARLPFEPHELAALGPEMIPALIVSSAELALQQQLPGGLLGLAQLGGGAHRDVFEAVAGGTYAPLATLAQKLLATM